MPDPARATYIRFYKLADADPLTAQAAIALQDHHPNPLGDEAIDAARLARAHHDRLRGDSAVMPPSWDALTDDERATASGDALHWLRAAREIGLAR